MYRHRFIKLLLLPSLFSTIVICAVAVLLIVGVNWSLVTDNVPFHNYFFGIDGAVTNLQEVSGVVPEPSDAFDGRALAILAGVLLAAIALLALIRSMMGIINSISWTVQEMRAVDGPAKSAVQRELGQRVTVRLLVITTWAAYCFIFIKVILPFCILSSQLGFSSERSVSEGIGYVFFAMALLVLCMHLHTVMARLLLLRPRVFGGEEAILVN